MTNILNRLKNEEVSDGLEDATRFVWDGKYTYYLHPRIPTSL